MKCTAKSLLSAVLLSIFLSCLLNKESLALESSSSSKDTKDLDQPKPPDFNDVVWKAMKKGFVDSVVSQAAQKTIKVATQELVKSYIADKMRKEIAEASGRAVSEISADQAARAAIEKSSEEAGKEMAIEVSERVSQVLSVYEIAKGVKSYGDSKNELQAYNATMDIVSGVVSLINPAAGMVVKLAALGSELQTGFMLNSYKEEFASLENKKIQIQNQYINILNKRAQLEIESFYDLFFQFIILSEKYDNSLNNDKLFAEKCRVVDVSKGKDEIEKCLDYSFQNLLLMKNLSRLGESLLSFPGSVISIEKILELRKIKLEDLKSDIGRVNSELKRIESTFDDEQIKYFNLASDAIMISLQPNVDNKINDFIECQKSVNEYLIKSIDNWSLYANLIKKNKIQEDQDEAEWLKRNAIENKHSALNLIYQCNGDFGSKTKKLLKIVNSYIN